MLVVDGVYVRRVGGEGDEDEAVSFEAAPSPSRDELVAMVEHIYARTMKWLHRHRLIRDSDESNAPASMSPTEALTALGMQRGTLVTMRVGADRAGDATSAETPPPRPTDAVVHQRFNLHASAPLRADDDVGRERLCRYLTRPAFSLERIRILRDGNVAYRVKRVSRNRVTERVMTPVEFMARLGSLVAPPRYPLLRLHGVLAPRHRWRSRVVPKPSPRRARSTTTEAAAPHSHGQQGTDETVASSKTLASSPTFEGALRAPSGEGQAALALPKPVTLDPLLQSGKAERLGPNILSADHWRRFSTGSSTPSAPGQSGRFS